MSDVEREVYCEKTDEPGPHRVVRHVNQTIVGVYPRTQRVNCYLYEYSEHALQQSLTEWTFFTERPIRYPMDQISARITGLPKLFNIMKHCAY